VRITLPPAEMQLMLAFVPSGGQVVRHTLLESAAWGLSDTVMPNALDVAIHCLRSMVNRSIFLRVQRFLSM